MRRHYIPQCISQGIVANPPPYIRAVYIHCPPIAPTLQANGANARLERRELYQERCVDPVLPKPTTPSERERKVETQTYKLATLARTLVLEHHVLVEDMWELIISLGASELLGMTEFNLLVQRISGVQEAVRGLSLCYRVTSAGEIVEVPQRSYPFANEFLLYPNVGNVVSSIGSPSLDCRRILTLPLAIAPWLKGAHSTGKRRLGEDDWHALLDRAWKRPIGRLHTLCNCPHCQKLALLEGVDVTVNPIPRDVVLDALREGGFCDDAENLESSSEKGAPLEN